MNKIIVSVLVSLNFLAFPLAIAQPVTVVCPYLDGRTVSSPLDLCGNLSSSRCEHYSSFTGNSYQYTVICEQGIAAMRINGQGSGLVTCQHFGHTDRQYQLKACQVSSLSSREQKNQCLNYCSANFEPGLSASACRRDCEARYP